MTKTKGEELRPDLTEARRLFDAGFKLCKLEHESKRPEGSKWNKHPVKEFDEDATGYGLLLAENDLVSIDPDLVAAASIVLAGFGFSLDELMTAGIRSLSTRKGSGGRAIFKNTDGLGWIKFNARGLGTILELRAASPNLQDVVPGLVYRDKGGELCTQTYTNCKRIPEGAPEVPAKFRAWWAKLSDDLDFLRECQTKAVEFLLAADPVKYAGIAPQPSISGKGGKLAHTSPWRDEFNEAHDVGDILDVHGYEQTTDGRYRAPDSTGAAGIRPIPGAVGLWQSDHGSDPLCGTFDAWTAHVVLDCGGDLAEAEADYRAGVGDALDAIELPAEVVAEAVAETKNQKLAASLIRDDKGRLITCLANVRAYLESPRLCGVDIRYDEFLCEVMIAHRPGEWVKMTDNDITELRTRFETLEKPIRLLHIGKDLMRDAVRAVGARNRFDSAKHWLNEIVPAWDGVPRIDRFWVNYFGADDSEYVREVGAYTWTGLAGRVLVPGIQLDMAPILQGDQGLTKSTALKAMVPSPEHFAELNLGAKDDDLSRAIVAKLICELGELKGMRNKEVEHTKSFITKPVEEWVPKYEEKRTRYPRRCMFFGTTNADEFLVDETGNRRWLPFTVRRADREAIARDMLQLWAEGRERFALNGIEWQGAERLAKDHHVAFTETDVWSEAFVRWLSERENKSAPFTAVDAIQGAVMIPVGQLNQGHKKRAAQVLKRLGYSDGRGYVNGVQMRVWSLDRSAVSK